MNIEIDCNITKRYNFLSMEPDKLLLEAAGRAVNFLNLSDEDLKLYPSNKIFGRFGYELTIEERRFLMQLVKLYINIDRSFGEVSLVWLESYNNFFNKSPKELVIAGEIKEVNSYLDNYLDC